MYRVDLFCPFDEKDEAKKLGAKWDAEKKTWYAIFSNRHELEPFKRWLFRRPEKKKKLEKPKVTGLDNVPDCGCDEPPWEHCRHTDREIEQHRMQMLAEWNHAEARMH